MFQLNRKAFSDTLLAVTELENSLISQRENQQNALDAYWQKNSGLTAQTLYTGYTNVLNNGVYAEAVNLAGGVRMSMEAAYPTLNRLVEQRRSLLERMGVDSSEDEDLVLDAAYKQDFISSFEEFETANYESMRALTEVMDTCGGLIDFAAEREALAADYQNCKWIGELGPEWQLHFKEIEDLEEGLRLDFGRYVDEAELARECSPRMPYNMWSMFAIQPSAIKLLQHKHPDSFSEGDIQALGEEWKHAVENADTETMQKILEVSINAESGEIDKGLLEAIGHYAGEEGALLTELARAKDKFPRFHYVDYAVQVKKEGETYEINLIQDVFLEKDNRYTVTMNGQGLVTGEKQIVTQLHSYTPGELRRAQELVEQGEDGSYGFEEVLSRDAGDISEADYELLGAVLEDKCRMLEYGPDREGAVGEAYDVTESMLESLFTTEERVGAMVGSRTVHLVSSTEKVKTLSDKVNKNSQAEIFLRRLSGYAGVMEGIPLPDVSGLGVMEEKKELEITISAHEKGHMVTLQHVSDTGEGYGIGEIYTISPLWAKQHIEGLPAETIAHAESIGYDEEKLLSVYLMPENEVDAAVTDHMIQREYQEITKVDPDGLSETVKLQFAEYGVALTQVTQTQVTEKGESVTCYPKLEELMNGLLYQDTEHCRADARYEDGAYYNDRYIRLMAVYTGVSADIKGMTLLSSNGKEETEEGTEEKIKEETWENYEMTLRLEPVWESLNAVLIGASFEEDPGTYMDENGELHYASYDLGESKMEITNFYYNDKDAFLMEMSHVTDEGVVFSNWSTSGVVSWNALGNDTVKENAMCRELEREKEMAFSNMLADGAIEVIGIAAPEFEALFHVLQGVSEGEYSDVVTEVEDNLHLPGKEESEGKNVIDRGFGLTVSGLRDTLKLNEDLEKIRQDALGNYFYSGTWYSYMDQTCGVREGILKRETMEGLWAWNEEGCGSFLADEAASESINNKIEEIQYIAAEGDDSQIEGISLEAVESILEEEEEVRKKKVANFMVDAAVSWNWESDVRDYRDVNAIDPQRQAITVFWR